MPELPITPDAAWIDRPEALHAWLEPLRESAIIGMDTEFTRRDTFHPQLALLQLGWGDQHALVDPLAFDLGGTLRGFLDTPRLSVMHSAGEDLETLAPLLPDGPAQLFDTQIAAAFCGLGLGISYRTLVAEIAKVELDKGETRSDWMQRPLTESQRAYATLDVVYLEPIHDALVRRLAQRDRGAWCAEDCERLRQRASHRDGDPQPQRALRGAADWPHERQALLRRILLWRDQRARTLDRPRPWLLDDATALALAQQPPDTAAALDQRTRGQRALRSAQRAELFDLLRTPVSAEECDAALPIPSPPQGEAKKVLAAMKDAVDRRAQSLDLPAGLLCPRKVLEDYLATRQWPAFLEGWRREITQPVLEPLLPDRP